MTVKIGMGSSALDLSDAQVWGNPVQKIMVGLGNAAALAWQRIKPLVPWRGETTTSVTVTRNVWTQVQANYVVGEGQSVIAAQWRFNSTALYFSKHWRRMRILVNGVQIGMWEHESQAPAWESSGVVERYLNEGDLIELQAYAEVDNTNLRTLTHNWLQYVPA